MAVSRDLQFLSQIDLHEAERYGGKAAGLVRLIRHGFRVPQGFAIACECFQDILRTRPAITRALDSLAKATQPDEILQSAEKVGNLLHEYCLPEYLQKEIEGLFRELQAISEKMHGYAVRSSANIEDTAITSFAGQGTTSLCVVDSDSILDSIRETWFSLFSLEGLLYLKSKDIPFESVQMGVVVQEMVPADVSGVMFTADVVESRMDRMLIDSTWGLGEPVVSGKITPDSFVIRKKPLEILQRRLGSKRLIARKSASSEEPGYSLSEMPEEKRAEFSLCDEDILTIAKIGMEIEHRLGRPQDIEWCMVGTDVIVVQARPITTLQQPCNGSR
ncbi:hypothetical protein EU545_04135 [Candidatus Thorarchaeota archaeon]|nr:MAG: hypothetical protein EU545_04135 [Candidatus Thorarchaeota archaeon]